MAEDLTDRNEDDPIAQINVVPFVDIVLVLLIIFMLTASIIAKGDIPVDLPRAASGNQTVGPTVNVVLTASGALFLDGEPVTTQELTARVRRRVQAEPGLRSVIAADRAVRYELVVEVIDALKQVGVEGFALNIERTGRP